jgi:Fe-S-cluster containining protein
VPVTLPVVNLSEATFECVYGRGCEGACCQQGRPPVPPDEAERIAAALPRVLPLLTPAARRLVEAEGFLSRRRKAGHPMARVIGSWCVFFNEGCALHKLGAAEGDPYRYKPTACSLFPLEQDSKYRWYVRQWGLKGEDWDLFCLNPAHSPKPAAESLRDEVALAERLSATPGTVYSPAPDRCIQSGG